jgi:hypothetical protein
VEGEHVPSGFHLGRHMSVDSVHESQLVVVVDWIMAK